MGRRLGLIIGVNNYQDSTFQTLQYAENDARAFAQWLVNVKGGVWSPGDVQLVQGTHATKELIESLMVQMCLSLAEPDDLVLIYFAGHAFLNEQNGDGYLALSNTQYSNPTTALHLLSFANQVMAHCRAAQMLVILDTFQTGPVWQVRRSSRYDAQPLIGPNLFNLLQQQGNRIFFYSCRGNAETPEIGERSLGPFMYSTIVGLSGPTRDPATGQASLQNLYMYLSSVLGEQHRPQPFGQERTPMILIGDAPSSTPQQEPPATPPDNLAASGGQRDTSGLFKQQSATATMSPPSPELQQQSQYMLNQAQQLVQAQQYMEALNLIEQILHINPQGAPALVLKGQILGTLRRFPEALSVVDQLMQLNPNNPLTWSMRAVLLTNMGQYQDALQSIDRSLALDGSNAETQAIKKNIMVTIAMTTSQETNRPFSEKGKTEPTSHNRPLSFLIAMAIQIVGLALGLIGILLPALLKLPTLIGALLMGLGLSLQCVNATRGTYRYGWIRLLPPFLISALAAGIIVFGGLLNLVIGGRTPTNHFLLNLLSTHATLVIPIFVLGIWLIAATALPPILALGGLVTGTMTKRRNP